MDMLCLFENLRIDVRQAHKVHRTLISQVSAVFIIAHTDSGTCSILVLTNEIARINAFRLKACFYQIAKTVVTDHTAESHSSSQSRSVSSKNSG